MSLTAMRGLSEPYGSWKTICNPAASGRICVEGKPAMSLPMKLMRPFEEIRRAQRQAERRLARAGFADDAERLARAHRQVDAVDRLHMVDDACGRSPALIGNQTFMSSPSMNGLAVSDAGGTPFGSAASRWRV